MTKKQWHKRSSDLRKLLHDENLRISGAFVKVFGDKGIYVYNNASERVIAYIGDTEAAVQPKSIYNGLLERFAEGKEIVKNPYLQSASVKRVATKITGKEVAYATKRQPQPKQPPTIRVNRFGIPTIETQRFIFSSPATTNGSNWYTEF